MPAELQCPFCGSVELSATQIHQCLECGASFEVHRTPDPPKLKKGK